MSAPNRIEALTGVRAVAAFHVFIFHAALAWPSIFLSNPFQEVISSGLIGVTVFFVLSGFVLSVSQLRSPHAELQNWKGFWGTRAARILPSYYLAVIAMLVIWPLYAITPVRDPSPTQFVGVALASLTLTQTWFQWMTFEGHGQAWSLDTEVIFYLLFPFIARWTARLRAANLLVGLGVLFLIELGIRQAFELGAVSWLTLYANPLFRLPEFILGVLIGRLFLLGPVRQAIWGGVSMLAWSAVFFLLLVNAYGVKTVPMLHPFLIPFFGLGIYAQARAPKTALTSCALDNPVMRYLGEISYAIYLWHGAALLIAKEALGLLDWRGPVLALGFTLIISAASYEFVEKPVMQWWRRAGRKHNLERREVASQSAD